MPQDLASFVHTNTYLVNPHQARMAEAMRHRAEVSDIVLLIQQLRRQYPTADRATIKRMAEQQGMKQKYLAVMKKIEEAKPEPLGQAEPPRNSVLYGRFTVTLQSGDPVKITDVGCGVGQRLKGLAKRKFDVEAIDVTDKFEKTLRRNIAFKVSEAGAFLRGFDGKRLLSSWMAISLLDDAAFGLLRSFDGLHLTSDYRSRDRFRLRNAEYGEEVIRDIPGYEVAPSYCLVAFFQPRQINIQFHVAGRDSYIPDTLTGPVDLSAVNWEDVSLKADGEFYELESNTTEVYLTDRAGNYKKSGNETVGFCLHLERMVDEEFPDRPYYVLLRVIHYNGMLPPHCIATLEEFCSQVKIRLDGCPIVPPVKTGPSQVADHKKPFKIEVDGAMLEYKFDGIITRSFEKDYYVKKKWTVDLDFTGMREAVKNIRDAGFDCDELDYYEGLGELEMKVDDEGGTVIFEYKRRRDDKMTATRMKTVLTLITLNDLSGPSGYKILTNSRGEQSVGTVLNACKS